MDIPHGHIEPETLRSLLVDFVTRDGAVQGHNDTSLQSRVAAVLDQLQAGAVKIVYDEASESFSIVPHDAVATDDGSRFKPTSHILAVRRGCLGGGQNGLPGPLLPCE